MSQTFGLSQHQMSALLNLHLTRVSASYARQYNTTPCHTIQYWSYNPATWFWSFSSDVVCTELFPNWPSSFVLQTYTSFGSSQSEKHIYFNSLIWTSFCDCLCHLPCGFLLHRPLQIVYNVMLYKWSLASSDKCGCGMVHTMSHVVDKCPVSKLHDAGLQSLTTLQLTGWKELQWQQSWNYTDNIW